MTGQWKTLEIKYNFNGSIVTQYAISMNNFISLPNPNNQYAQILNASYAMYENVVDVTKTVSVLYYGGSLRIYANDSQFNLASTVPFSPTLSISYNFNVQTFS